MTDDKTRAEFEKEFPLPGDCEWDGIEAYCWVYTRAPHPHNKHWEGWQAAKARYGQMDDAHTFLAGKVLVPVAEMRKQIIDCLLSTSGLSDGVTADAIVSMLTASKEPNQ